MERFALVPIFSVTLCLRARKILWFIGNHPIDDSDGTMGVFGDVGIVRNEKNADSFFIQFLKHFQNLDARRRIEVSRRLIGEK